MKTLAAMAVIDAFIFGAGYATCATRHAWRKAGRDIDQAVAMVCKPCSWTDTAAPCTCPPRGCTATTCPKREVRR